MPIVVTSPHDQAPSTDVTSPDGRIRATVMSATAGVFLRVDYTGMLGLLGFDWPNPFRITIWRETPDGVVTAVRGAQNISQYGAIFHAYDDEVNFGQQVVYWAEAPTVDGSQIVETDKISVLTWEPDGGFTSPGVWIKNLENPDLSTPARCIDWSAGSWASRNATADVWGSPQPAVTTDVRKSYNTGMTVLTKDEDEYQALLAAIDASVVYVVGLERHRRRTGYYLIGDIAPSRIGPANSDYDAWTIGLTGMGRPISYGQSLSVPGRSYTDRQAVYAEYDDIPYDVHLIRATALTTTATTRIGVNALKTVPVAPGVTHTLTMHVKLTAAASRALYAGLSLWDASNTQLTSPTGADFTVAPGGTGTIVLTTSTLTGVRTRPFLTGKSMVSGERMELIDATLTSSADPTGANLLLPEDQGPYGDTVGNWVDLGNTTVFLTPSTRRPYSKGTEPY